MWFVYVLGFQPPVIGTCVTYAYLIDVIENACDRVYHRVSLWLVCTCVSLCSLAWLMGYMYVYVVRIRTGVSTSGHQDLCYVCLSHRRHREYLWSCISFVDVIIECSWSYICLCLFIRFVYVLGFQPPVIRTRVTYAYLIDVIENACNRVYHRVSLWLVCTCVSLCSLAWLMGYMYVYVVCIRTGVSTSGHQDLCYVCLSHRRHRECLWSCISSCVIVTCVQLCVIM
jgi:hypothetical protein